MIKICNRIGKILFQVWNIYKMRSNGNIQLYDRGKDYHLIGSFYIRTKEKSIIKVGSKLTISSGFCYNPICRNIKTALFADKNASLIIGDNVGISGSCIWAHEKITIGNNVKIGADSIVVDSDCHSLDCITRNSILDQTEKKNKPIVIGDDVLIGARSIILKGVNIGARSIIGAGSVVTKSIPEDCIAAGNPCKIIRYITK